jgi:hypothetical protein
MKRSLNFKNLIAVVLLQKQASGMFAKMRGKVFYKFNTSIVNVFLFCLISGAVSASSALAQQDFTIKSEILQETREMVVHLPKNNDPNNKEGYPVLYTLDADQKSDEIAAQTAGENDP